MNATRTTIRKFNPGALQSDDELIEQFVVRQRELQLVLEILNGNIDANSCQHLLVTGPRGRGKTMLLARVCAELRTNDTFAKHLFPVRFMEESQEIANIADFWLEALFHLANANAAANPELSGEFFATHKDLTARWQDSNIEELAHAAVLSAADRLGRKLVLMVENLQSLSEDVDADFGWKLRKTLQSDPQVILLATTTSHFKGLDEVNGPFFELFRILDLEPLALSECVELWRMASGEERDSREIKPLRILTGGSPRLLVIVATFAEHRSLSQLLEDLVALVDDHTEYFRNHLEVIAKTERRVYLAVLDLWRPSSPGEIATRARMDVRNVSALLARLADRGVLLIEGTGRKRLYSAAERLYSIYYKLRRERDEATVVQQLIQFMSIFYCGEKNDEVFGLIRMEATRSPAIRSGFLRVMDSGGSYEFGRDRDREASVQFQAAAKLLQKINAQSRNVEFGRAVETCQEMVDRFGDSVAPELQVMVAIAWVRKGDMLEKMDEFDDAMSCWGAVIERFGNSELTELQKLTAFALSCRGHLHFRRLEPDDAIESWSELIDRFGDSGIRELEEAGVQSRNCGESGNDVRTLHGVAWRVGNREPPSFQQTVADALGFLAQVELLLGRAEDALRRIERFETRFRAFARDRRFTLPVVSMMLSKAHAMLILGNRDACLDAFRSAYIEMNTDHAEVAGHMMHRMGKLMKAGVSAGELAEIVTVEGKAAGILMPYIVALREYAGESVRAPAEVSEVAGDVRESFEQES